jgi:uncharacterized protein YjbI with pentapeptide repeats
MANEHHLSILQKGVAVWNQWRQENPDIDPDLAGADLSRLTNIALKFANFARIDLSSANLDYAYLKGTDFRGAKLHQTKCHNATLIEANLTDASLTGARLSRANFYRADCTNANFSGAYLGGASLVETDVEGACFDNCEVYGLSVWGVRGSPRSQMNLLVTPPGEQSVTVDRLEVAQLVFTFLLNPTIRNVIDTIAKRAVLILGRFTTERLVVLHELKTALRARGLIPILFDFEKPSTRNFTETVSTLAHLARFIIADLTDPRSIPQELQRIVPGLPSLPVQPLIAAEQDEYSMFPDLLQYPWVLAPYRYSSVADLLTHLVRILINLNADSGRT